MPIPNDVTPSDSLAHMRETLNETIQVIRDFDIISEYKAAGNSYFTDFVGGWKGTPFRVYFNGILPYGTQVVPGGRTAFGSINEDLQRSRFESFDVVHDPLSGHSLATFKTDDFDTDGYAVGAIIAPGWMLTSGGEKISFEVRLRLPVSNHTFTIGFFGNATGSPLPLLLSAVEDAAPTHANFVGVWFSNELGHTTWRRMIRAGSVTTVDSSMTGATVNTSFITFRVERPIGSSTFEFFVNGVSKGTGASPSVVQPYAFGIIGGTPSAGFEVDYLKIEHDLNADARP